jgi:flagellar motor switch protein FliM
MKLTEYPAFQFSNLEKFSSEELNLLNRAEAYFARTDEIEKILSAVSQVLLVFDIYNSEEVEISLLVKPAGEIGKPQYFRMKQPSVNLGRTAENHIPLKSPLVSKKHAEIFRRGVDFYLRDLNSNNGTFLNQVKLSSGGEVVLKNDDIIRVEPFEIVVGLPADVGKKPLPIRLESVRVRKELLSGTTISVFFQIQPSGTTAVLCLENTVARWMVQKIITGQKESPLSPWTEIEGGLLEYLAAKILATVNHNLQNSRLVLQSVEHEEDQFQEWFSKNGPFVEVTFATDSEIGKVFGFLYVPAIIISAPESESIPVPFIDRAPWLKKLRYTFSVNLGISLLSADQIALLETGDIILLDQARVTLVEGIPKGKAEIRSERMRRGVIETDLECEGQDICRLTVVSLYQEGLKSMTDSEKKNEEGQADANEGVLASIEVPILVELARLNYTLEELSAIKQGQVIEIKKPQPEVVDLSVDGKIIASGKLVDIDGKLGVRILKIIHSK